MGHPATGGGGFSLELAQIKVKIPTLSLQKTQGQGWGNPAWVAPQIFGLIVPHNAPRRASRSGRLAIAALSDAQDGDDLPTLCGQAKSI